MGDCRSSPRTQVATRADSLSSPVNCATGADGASVVVVVEVVVVVVGAGGIVVAGATTEVVDEVGGRDRRLVPAPLHAVRNNAIAQTG